MPCSLVLIDGLPGAGKSTLGGQVMSRLVQDGYKVIGVGETDANHPLHPIPAEEMGAAWSDIHERISAQDFADASLQRWAEFTSSLEPGSIGLVESFPFQSAVRVLMQMDASRETINDYWLRWTELVRPHKAHLIYLKTDDAKAQISRIAQRRGPEWTAYLSDAVQQMPYCVNRGYSGWSAVETLLADYKQLIDQVVETSPIPVSTFEAEPADYDERLEGVLKRLQSALPKA